MKFKHSHLVLLSLFSFGAFAQESTIDVAKDAEMLKKEIPMSYLDSIRSTLVYDDMTACIDSLWLKELTNLDLYNDISSDIAKIDLDEKVDFELSTELLKERLAIMDARSPFNIEYNKGLENIIKSFLKNRKRSFERLMAISEYYFPMFEEALAKKNVPLEIKYLAVVESALNPKAVSHMGATGLWQFMYQTGKQYNLNIDSYVDERSDPLKASNAAAQYMTNMYKIFGDWDLVLASYNAGPGNVAKAIRRSGGQQNYWNIRKNLPKETQGYVPAFLATMYIYEFHKEHGIVPNRALVKSFETDTVMIKNHITFKQLADVLDVPVSQLQLLNPSYKLDVVPFYADKNHYIRMPREKVALFTANEDAVYAYANHIKNLREKPNSQQQYASVTTGSTKSTITRTKLHKVRSGESLGKISEKYGVSIANLKKWNGLRSNVIAAGKSLKIISTETINVKAQPEAIVKKSEAIAAKAPQKEAVVEDDETKFYTVKKGESLYAVAKKHNVTVDQIKDWNKFGGDNLVAGIKIIVDKKVDENENTAVAEVAEVDEVVAPTEYSLKYHVVKKGEFLGIIAKQNNLTLAELKEMNSLESNTVNAGTRIIIAKTPVDKSGLSQKTKTQNTQIAAREKETQKSYYVQKGDSLFSIAKKHPGVTISDLKQWNGIGSNGNIKPGMKLKIQG